MITAAGSIATQTARVAARGGIVALLFAAIVGLSIYRPGI